MNVCDLTGPELDVWVARALEAGEPSGVDKYGAPIVNGKRSLAFLIEKYRDFPQAWSPSTKWEDGGPIIEREAIELFTIPLADGWRASKQMPGFYHIDLWGPTLLVAAMRCFVSSKFGDTACKK